MDGFERARFCKHDCALGIDERGVRREAFEIILFRYHTRSRANKSLCELRPNLERESGEAASHWLRA